MEIDFHGYHPSQIVWSGALSKIAEQAWEMGETHLYLIHGHGRNRGIKPGPEPGLFPEPAPRNRMLSTATARASPSSQPNQAP
jgi:hypothetical protein